MILTMESIADNIRRQGECHAKYNENTIVLFRYRDYYTTYNDDAKRVSEATGCRVASDGDTDSIEFPRLMLDVYLPKLVRKGYRIAIIDGKVI